MLLKFLGTKGEIEESNKYHRKHSSLLINKDIQIDYGSDFKTKPKYILVTHAHLDHISNLKGKSSIIYLTKETLKLIKFKLKNYVLIKANKPFKLNNLKIIPYTALHSLKVPTLGFKIIGNKTLLYNPDLINIKNKNILKNADYYIGDGSIYSKNLIRKKDNKRFGHISIKNQILLCKKYKIKNIIFTHFGKEIIRMKDKNLKEKLKMYNLNIKIAYDGMSLNI